MSQHTSRDLHTCSQTSSLENSLQQENTREVDQSQEVPYQLYLAAIIESSDDAIIGKTLDGVVTSWNPAAERLYGYSAQEIIGKPIATIVPSELHDDLARIMQQLREGTKIDHYETIRVRKDGTRVNVSITISPIKGPSGEIIGASTIARDVTIQKRAEERAQQSRDELHAILQNVADGITVQDTKGTLIYANDIAARLCGFSSAEAMLAAASNEKKFAEVLNKVAMKDELGNPLSQDQLPGRQALGGQKNVQAFVQYSDAVTGQIRWSLVKAEPIFDAYGQVQFAVNVISDLTEERAFEQRKDEFIRMASHELKTPITVLKGFASLLERRVVKLGDSGSLSFLARMNGQLDKLTKLISDLLDISKMQVGKLDYREEYFDLDGLARETVETLQETTQTHRLDFVGQANVQVFGDRDRIGQVLINLLTNAIKYSPRADKVVVRVSTDQGQAILGVQDFGIGIDDFHQEHIFERFYQIAEPTEKTYPGLGIGLYISREIVRRHHGQIWVESQKGQGTTFYVSLPVRNQNK